MKTEGRLLRVCRLALLIMLAGSIAGIASGRITVSAATNATAKQIESYFGATQQSNGTFILTDGTVFDPIYYAAKYPDVVNAFGNDAKMLIFHYECCGRDEHRFPNAAAEQGYNEVHQIETTETPVQTVVPKAPLSEFEQLVQSILVQQVTPGMDPIEQLRKCYNYVMNTTTYRRTYETPSGDWTKQYATDIYTTGRGNCYRYAAAFAYLAEEILKDDPNSDVKIITGQISAARGGLTPHGWVQITIGGVPYLFDPDMQDAHPGTNYFMVTQKAYPVKPLNPEKEWDVTF